MTTAQAATTAASDKVHSAPAPEKVQELRSTISRKLAETAIATFREVMDLTWQKGGYSDLQDQLREVRGNLSNGMMEIARQAWKDAGKDKRHGMAHFESACKLAESIGKTEDKDHRPVKEICPSWPVIKSGVIRALKAGANPTEAKTFYDLQEQAKEMRKGEVRTARARKIKVTKNLGTVLESLNSTLAALGNEEQDEAAEILASAMIEISALMPQVREDDTQEEDETEEQAESEAPRAAKPARSRKKQAA